MDDRLPDARQHPWSGLFMRVRSEGVQLPVHCRLLRWLQSRFGSVDEFRRGGVAVHWLALVALVAPIALACAGRGFEEARTEDTAAAYHRYLREHPDSQHAEEARQRLEFVRIRSKPSVEAYEAFAKRWPQSPLLAELRVLAAEPAFARARAWGTAQAYREFLEEFGESPHTQRARGNAAYVEARGFGGRPEALADFAARYAESDFAAEAARSAASLEARARSGFQRAGLVIEFSSSTQGRQRLAQVFADADSVLPPGPQQGRHIRRPRSPRVGWLIGQKPTGKARG